MADRKKSHISAREMAFGGMMAALAVVVMCLGGLVPVATFVCPIICMLILKLVSHLCGNRIGWIWYAVVAILSLLMGPDKEAAAVFLFLGYYPLVKGKLEKLPLPWLWKGVLFNIVIVCMYTLLIHLFGMAALAEEFQAMGTLLLAGMLVLGNFTFFLLDRLLSRGFRR